MRYQPYGLEPADLKAPYEDIVPDRVQKKIDIHRRNHIEYPWDQMDKNERIFEYRKMLRPQTYKYNINSIYRIRNPSTKQEYYVYSKKGFVQNDNNEIEQSNTLTYGYEIEPVHELKYNERAKRKEPVKVRDDPVYFFKWNTKEVKKLLEGSEVPCKNFYIGTCAESEKVKSQGACNDTLTVKYFEDWLNGNFEDLTLLNKAGIMNREASTLHLVEEAKSRFKEEQLRRIAQVSTPQPTPNLNPNPTPQ